MILGEKKKKTLNLYVKFFYFLFYFQRQLTINGANASSKTPKLGDF